VAINLSVVVEGFQLGAGNLLIDSKGLKHFPIVVKDKSARNWHTVCVCGSTPDMEQKCVSIQYVPGQ
jgi:hypothetical protein